MADAGTMHQMHTDACTVAIRSDVPLLRVGLERAVRLAGLRPVSGSECPDITIGADGWPGAEHVTITVRATSSRRAWSALGDLVDELEWTIGTTTVNDRGPGSRRQDLP